ncbi:unnamed protein product [Amoebophrya sp. A25]|nr:unnamed protein product [Amoebophrya sp. A25]|eukprot:GSA25T00016616001.1
MGLKYVAAYLLEVLAGKEEPTAADLQRVIESVGDFDSAVAEKLCSEMKSTCVHEVIAAGKEKLQGFGGGSGGSAAGAAAASGGAAAAEEKKEGAPPEEEEDDMEFDLFD